MSGRKRGIQMKMIIVGASGLIGSAVYRLAKARNIEVIGLARKECGDGIYPFHIADDSIGAILAKRPFLGGKEKICAVIAAGVTNIRQCYENRAYSDAVNVTGMKKLLSFFSGHGIKTLYLSSDAVFDGKKGNYCETDIPRPLCVYGRQKLEIESYIAQHMPDGLVYRLSKVVDECSRFNHLFREFYEQFQRGEEIECIEGLRFCPTCARDVARAILLGFELELKGVYHVANDQRFSRYALAKMCLASFGSSKLPLRAPMENFTFKEPKALDTTLNTEKFRRASGMRFTTIDEALPRFIENLQKEGLPDKK